MGTGQQRGGSRIQSALVGNYDNEVDVRTARALGLLEPIIIVVLALVVGFILMAVYLPIMNLNQSI